VGEIGRERKKIFEGGEKNVTRERRTALEGDRWQRGFLGKKEPVEGGNWGRRETSELMQI